MNKRFVFPLLIIVMAAWWAVGRVSLNRPAPGDPGVVVTATPSAPAPSAAAPAPASGMDSACRANLPQGRPPNFVALRVQVRYLCYPSFAVAHLAATRTPLWSAEYLTPERVQAARRTRRVNAFHADPHLPPSEAAQLSDYVHSGYDRGHLSPSGDQPDPATQEDSFSLANIAPQDPGLNRGPWEELESATRDLAALEPVYVITGVRFVGQQIDFLHNRVGVPTSFYKLIYDPARHAAVVFEAPNQVGGQPRAQSVAAFEQASGLRFGLGAVSLLALPSATPSPYRHRGSR